MTITFLNHVITGSQNLISQYQNSPNVKNLIASFTSASLSLEQALYDCYYNTLNLDSSVGAQLDTCGSILDEVRNNRTDSQYRRSLRTKVLVIISQGRIEDLLKIIRAYQLTTSTDNSDIQFHTFHTTNRLANVGYVGSLKRQTEAHIIPDNDGQYKDGIYDPNGQHYRLLEAKAAGESLQSVFGTVATGSLPLSRSAYFSNDSTASNLTRGWGWSGDTVNGGFWAYRLKDIPNLARPAQAIYTGEYDEGFVWFSLSSLTSSQSFNFVFSDLPTAIILTPEGSTSPAGSVAIYGISFTSASFVAGVSAPLSGHFRYRAVRAPAYPALCTSSLVPGSGTFEVSAGKITAPKAIFTASYQALTGGVNLFYHTPWGSDASVEVTVDDIEINYTLGQTSAPLPSSSGSIHFIAVDLP